MAVFLLWVVFQTETLQQVKIEDIIGPVIVSAETSEGFTYFTLLDKGARIPRFVFYAWNHQKDTFWKVDDGRIPMYARFVMELNGEMVGYSLADARVIVWDRQLRFKRTDNLWHLLKIPEEPGLKLKGIDPYGKGRKLVAFQKESRVHLGQYSDSEPFRLLTSYPVTAESQKSSWVFSQGTLFFLEGDTGRIQVLDAQFRPARTLLKGFKPVPSKNRPTEKKFGLPETYENMTFAPWAHPNILQVWYTWYYDDYGKRQEPVKELLLLHPDKWSRCFDQRLLVGNSPTKDLLFDPAEYTFALEPHASERF